MNVSINTKWYDDIFKDFKNYHPYMIEDVKSVRPRGEIGIRIEMRDGSKYDYDMNTKGIRRVKDFLISNDVEITDEWCRDSFAYHLIEQMGAKGFTQETLSKSSGIAKGSINKYIHKQSTPSMTALRRIAKALDCSIADLLD